MKIQQIRNATLLVEYAGKRFLIDPLFAEKGAYPGFEGTANNHLSNPLVELPVTIEDLNDVEAVIVTHLHPDHWDEAAKRRLAKDLPIYAQNEEDANSIQSDGFTNVKALDDKTSIGEIELHKTPGQHGSDIAYQHIGNLLGKVCGVVFTHSSEKTLYLTGDTIWNEYVADNLKRFDPDVVVLAAGDAQIPDLGSIIMNKNDIQTVHKAAPRATLVASHMEAVNHCLLSRSELRDFADASGFGSQIKIPQDGESVHF
ncbi:MBL fold metallo-hydrolase [Pelagicoccus sp. SDUM812002]|uniref:MBL fold metallo-hydrolase n=1 Tax=Pelagicoccus sp. SDUM812002 TaxID=3041266 RepID=UPI00280ED093|nr:MBL fold metallo-hydrolase [Pelagicoccus sp. SDUM812002]MDQ8185838.1 MBL fold metallo-hydrolase [Pelagicoccus sp. SDUM812002]